MSKRAVPIGALLGTVLLAAACGGEIAARIATPAQAPEGTPTQASEDEPDSEFGDGDSHTHEDGTEHTHDDESAEEDEVGHGVPGGDAASTTTVPVVDVESDLLNQIFGVKADFQVMRIWKKARHI